MAAQGAQAGGGEREHVPAEGLDGAGRDLSPVRDLIGYGAIGLPAAGLLGYAAGLHTLGIRLGLLTGLAATAILLLRRYTASLRAQFTAQQTVPAG